MRRHVTVALSGDGGDEGFGGYDKYWQLRPLDLLRRAPLPVARLATAVADPAARMGLVRGTLPIRMRELARADDVTVLQCLFLAAASRARRSPRRPGLDRAGAATLRAGGSYLPPSTSHLERLGARAIETNLRLILPDDYLFKVDAGSMRLSSRFGSDFSTRIWSASA